MPFFLGHRPTDLSGDHSEWVPPDPISNSEVKTLSADGSVGSPHVRVGHRQALKMRKPFPKGNGIFFARSESLWQARVGKPEISGDRDRTGKPKISGPVKLLGFSVVD